MKSIAICSLLLAGSDAFSPSAGVRRHRPSTIGPASSLFGSHQGPRTTAPAETSLNSSISPDREDASSMFATVDDPLSWVDLPNNKGQERQGQADAFELYAGRVAMVASLGLLAGEFLNHKSITDQVLCALHIID